jgi:solute carrier family 25 S-adenosylmethionine transporter 26
MKRLRRYPSLSGSDNGSILDDALAGAAAGGIAAALTTPLDVIRTRHVLRAAIPVHTRPVHTPPDVSFIGTARLIFHKEGARGFVRGLLPRTIYMGLGGILYLGTYSLASRRLSAAADRDG